MVRTRLHRLTAVFTLSLVAPFAAAGEAWQPDLTQVVQHNIKLSDTVWMIEPRPGYGGNLAVSVGEDGVLLVDDQLMPLVPKIRQSLGKITKGEVDFLVNSHYHYDHAGGNEAFGATATIVAHKNIRMRLAEGREAANNFIEGDRPKAALPVITFSEKITFHYNGEDIEAYYGPNPSHTDGDTTIFFKTSNVMHTGDQYVNLNGYPFIDLDVGGSATGLRDNIALMLEIADDDTKIIPGHGPLAAKADLQAYHDRLDTTIKHIAALKAKGKTLAEAQAAGLPEPYTMFKGFMPANVWIAAVYTSLP